MDPLAVDPKRIFDTVVAAYLLDSVRSDFGDAYIADTYVGKALPAAQGEEGAAGQDAPEGFVGGDRTTILLPKAQTEVMKQVVEAGIPLVFVSMSGSAVAFPWEAAHADAILQAWYGGQAAGSRLFCGSRGFPGVPAPFRT